MVADKAPRTDTSRITLARDAICDTRAKAETAINTLRPCNPEPRFALPDLIRIESSRHSPANV
jgi:hypothetical protein